MHLTKHLTTEGPKWAFNGKLLPAGTTLAELLRIPADSLLEKLGQIVTEEEAAGQLLAPIEANQEVWASGVTYLSSRLAREAESASADVYQTVYNADRPELFFKSTGVRAVGSGEPIRVREDSAWDVPEPELTLVINSKGEVVGYTVGNDVSSRSIEGENPLYLPQAKVYDRSCAIGPSICIRPIDTLKPIPINLSISRDGEVAFSGETSTSQIKRPLEELVEYLYRELAFPHGAFLMTGTGIVPGEDFTLMSGDTVRIDIDGLVLENTVQ